MRYKSSILVVEEVKCRYNNTNDEFEFKWDLSYLDAKLKEMLYLEKKIGWTKKTVNQNHLIKKLNKMHSKADSYVYNKNRHNLFLHVEREVEKEMNKAIEESLLSLALVSSVSRKGVDNY